MQAIFVVVGVGFDVEASLLDDDRAEKASTNERKYLSTFKENDSLDR